MKAYLVAINSKYIHPAMGVFSIACNSNYPVIYDEFNIKDKKEKIINTILEQDYDILCFSVYICKFKAGIFNFYHCKITCIIPTYKCCIIIIIC